MERRGLQLDRVVLLGRTFEEYCHYFALEADELKDKRILDLASGVSSFATEARQAGCSVVAADPIYAMSPERIGARCGPDLDHVYNAIQNLSIYRWNWYQSPQHMRSLRERACASFLTDFRKGKNRHYIAAQLPELPFKDGAFDLCLVSYFLFVYQDQLTYEFHRDSISEIMRVSRGEARIYPTVTFEAERSTYLDRLKSDPALNQFELNEIHTDFEFLLGSNSYLQIQRKP